MLHKRLAVSLVVSSTLVLGAWTQAAFGTTRPGSAASEPAVARFVPPPQSSGQPTGRGAQPGDAATAAPTAAPSTSTAAPATTPATTPAGASPPAAPSTASPSTAAAAPAASPPPSATAGSTATAAPAGAGPVLKLTGSDGVALTFDDGPSPTHTPQLLALLRQHGVKATFCLVGVEVRANPQLVAAIVRDGHALCNHSWSHDLRLGTRSAEHIRADLKRTNDEIHKVVPGTPIRYFRHPGGNWTPAAIQIAQDLGMAAAGWDVDPRDWDTKAYGTGAGMTAHIVAAVRQKTRPGSIVLAHDAGGERAATIAAMRILLPELAQRFRLVALPSGTAAAPQAAPTRDHE
jgi:peptidoglycan/xylan/chitin deacetylase (PgdA/CDA1 family)